MSEWPSPSPLVSALAWRVGVPAAWLVARVAWRVRLDRGRGFPSPPFVIASNHHSFLDPVLVAVAYRRRTSFLALVDLFGNHRLLDLALVAFGAIPVRRGGVPLGPLRRALDHLESGGVVGVFPEGTRSWRFGDVPVRRGAAWLAARAGVPLVPVAVMGTDRVLGVDNRLHRGRVRLVVGEALTAVDRDREAVATLAEQWHRWMESTLLEWP